MKIPPMLLPQKILYFLFFLSILIVLAGVWLKIGHYTFGPFSGTVLLGLGIIPGMIVWLVVFYDIMKQGVPNAILWMLGMLVFGSVVPILYLRQRHRLVKPR